MSPFKCMYCNKWEMHQSKYMGMLTLLILTLANTLNFLDRTTIAGKIYVTIGHSSFKAYL